MSELESNYTITHIEHGPWVDNLGGESLKTFATLTYLNNEGREITDRFFLKNFKRKNVLLDTAREVARTDYQRYIYCKELGIDVPEQAITFENEEGPQIAYSDLTENGRYTVWSINNISGDFIPMRISSENLQRLKEQILQISSKIQEADSTMVLAFNAYFVVGNIDEGYRFVVGDFGDSIYFVDTPEQARELNEQSFKDLHIFLNDYVRD